MSAIEDRTAIYDLSARYASTADRREFEKLRDIFTPDGTLGAYFGDPTTVEPLFKVAGVDNIIQAFSALHRYESTFHFVGQQLIHELGKDGARTETYCVASHWHTKRGASQCVVWYIRYHDELVKQGGSWKLKARTIIIDRAEGEDV
jgi:hypothetical protein